MSIFSELKRRNVFRVAATYVVSAWLLIEIGNEELMADVLLARGSAGNLAEADSVVDDLEAGSRDAGRDRQGPLQAGLVAGAAAAAEAALAIDPEDVRAIVHDCLRHRLMLTYEANAAGISADAVIDELIKQVAVA